ncbi:hypothetical protein BSG18_30160 [Pseudomonas ogarae]|nr:hypothetical protein BSG18_30160 [Pseudomonas ogarae]
MISRIKVGTLQVLQRPTLLIDAIKKMSLKALYLPDRKRILLDASLPKLKHRWNEAHEIGHSLLPWHDAVMHGDNDHTLSRRCHEIVEAEANFAGGKLLFMQHRFDDEAKSRVPSINSIIELKGFFGNTLSSTLYRFVETVGTDLPMVGVITGHPHVTRRGSDFDPLNPCRHLIQSPAFSAKFGQISEVEVFKHISDYCGSQSGGPLGKDELELRDCNGDLHLFQFETFYNRYDSLTLGIYRKPKNLIL